MLQRPKKREFILIFSILGIVLVSGCLDAAFSNINIGCCSFPIPPTTTSTLPGGVAGCGPNERGDVNNDGSVNAVDSALVLQYTSGLLPNMEQLYPGSITRADVNGNNQVNTVDAALILQYVVGMIDLDDFAACSPVTCAPGNSPVTTSGVCDEDCGSSPECQGKTVGAPANGGGICNSQCEGGCTPGCSGCGYYRNSDCTVSPNAYCAGDQYCGNTIQHDLSCTTGCAGCALFRENNCNGRVEGLCMSDTYCADPPSGSCIPKCTGCNTLLTSECKTTFDNYICSALCTTPYIWPTAATYISNYMNAGHPLGIDIAGTYGESVNAMSPGTVVSSQNSCTTGDTTCEGCGAGRVGNCVLLQHDDGRYSLYGHLKVATVTSGHVNKGIKIGEMGNTGYVTDNNGNSCPSSSTTCGVHVHLEVRTSDGTRTDPCSYDALDDTC